jgi:hypothetical protein
MCAGMGWDWPRHLQDELQELWKRYYNDEITREERNKHIWAMELRVRAGETAPPIRVQQKAREARTRRRVGFTLILSARQREGGLPHSR